MPRTSPHALRGSLAALALALAGCAHLPRASEATRARGAAEAEAEALAGAGAKVLVTGSRIPRRVSARSGLPETFSPLRIHTRAEVLRAGAPGDLGATLHRVDPAVGP